MHPSSFDEFALIAHLTRSLPSDPDVLFGVGDDCAVLALSPDTVLFSTCDSQVEGVHFTLQSSTPVQIGRKSLAVNLSDIAAMGGTPRFALISLILPSNFPVPTLDAIYSGLQQEAATFSTTIVGGNISNSGASTQLVIDVTLLGTGARSQVLTRSGARVGDLLCVTGSPGNSAAGLYTLLHPSPTFSRPALEAVQLSHLTPLPRVREGQLLAQFGPDIITSLLDVSDGLSGDLSHICALSKVGARVELSSLPLSSSLLTIAAEANLDPFPWALHGGEDYELLFTVSPNHVQQVCSHLQSLTGTPVTPIGSILPADQGLQLLFPDGHLSPLPVKSWNHLSLS